MRKAAKRLIQRNAMARRKLYPMPIETLADHPEFIALGAAARGITFSLLLHFWLTDCRPLPISDRELRSIGRAHVPVWKHYKAAILSVVEAVQPDLVAYKRHRDMRAHVIQLVGRKGGAATRAKAQQKALQQAAPAPAITLATPQREPASGPLEAHTRPAQSKASPRFAQRTR